MVSSSGMIFEQQRGVGEITMTEKMLPEPVDGLKPFLLPAGDWQVEDEKSYYQLNKLVVF